jgi:hypothetical protein
MCTSRRHGMIFASFIGIFTIPPLPRKEPNFSYRLLRAIYPQYTGKRELTKFLDLLAKEERRQR